MSYYRQGPHRPGGGGIQIGVPTLTPYVRLIMIACGVVWFAQMVLSWGGILPSLWLGARPAWIVRGAVWQLFTYMWLHSPQYLFHILFNMLMLWMFGGELERHWGGRAFLRYYIVAGVGGGLFATFLGYMPGGSPVMPVIGASGAIFGLIVAYGMIFGERTILFMLIFPMKARTMAILLFAIAFLNTVGQPGSRVSHAAHLGGAVIGYLYLKRVWRIGEFYRDLRWKLRRRRFKVMTQRDSDDFDRWVN